MNTKSIEKGEIHLNSKKNLEIMRHSGLVHVQHLYNVQSVTVYLELNEVNLEPALERSEESENM